jgi:hypothetical protein
MLGDISPRNGKSFQKNQNAILWGVQRSERREIVAPAEFQRSLKMSLNSRDLVAKGKSDWMCRNL